MIQLGTYSLSASASQLGAGVSSSFSVSTNPDIVYPSDSGVVNVKSYGAKGDGVTDDTQAILSAMQANTSTASTTRDHIIYFPTGTYLVSNQLIWTDSSGNWVAYLSFQGQNKANTIIKLKNSAAGYGDKANPKAVIFTGSISSIGNITPNNLTTNPTGDGNAAFRNHITNLTIDTGTGNPGAIGIDYREAITAK